jgi:hypothetical protein
MSQAGCLSFIVGQGMNTIPELASCDAFQMFVGQVGWFTRLGQVEDGVASIPDWESWPGPEDRRVESIHTAQGEMHSRVVRDGDQQLKVLWDHVVERVVESAKASVPFHAESDAWHAPTSAVYHAAWTAALIAVHLRGGIRVPQDLIEQWKWFRAGHWPCARGTENGTFIIY